MTRAAVAACLALATAGMAGALRAQGPALQPRVAGADPSRASAGADDLRDVLGGVDFVPDRDDIEDRLGDIDGDPADELVRLARGVIEGVEVDPGIRLRAYRALALYDGKSVESALASAVDYHQQARDGLDIIYLRAAMSSLAAVARDDVVSQLAPVLDHVNQDARAAAARALARTGDKGALQPLYARLANPAETSAMVLGALRDAIDQLLAD